MFDNICNICLEDKGKLKTLKCGHSFHKKCIDKWIKTSHNKNTVALCPTCRTAIEFKKKLEVKKIQIPYYYESSDSDDGDY